MLTHYAASDANSRGRRHAEPLPGDRTTHQRDRDRIIHSGAFRRLEYKTQVFVNHEGDMFRTRLTHSLEVAQICRSIARSLQLNEDLAEAISLAHDLGHTPFGHAGQDALNECMRDYGGFEHNVQSLRVVDLLEEKYPDFPGLNLSFETREGILKHCSPELAPRLGDVGERFLQGGQPSLEAQLANLCDEIAYNTHDLDDGLRAGMLDLDGLSEESDFFALHLRSARADYPHLDERRLTHEVIRRLVKAQIADLRGSSQAALERIEPADIEAVRSHPRALVRFSSEMRTHNDLLKQLLYTRVYDHYRVRRMTVKARQVVRDLFECFFADPRLLPPPAQQRVAALTRRKGTRGQARGVADYIAGMTDRYAILERQRLFDPEIS